MWNTLQDYGILNKAEPRQEPLQNKSGWPAYCLFTTSLTAVTQAAVVLASCTALCTGELSDRIKPAGSNLLHTCSFEVIDFYLTSNELMLSERYYCERANITLRFTSSTLSPAYFLLGRLVFAACMISNDQGLLGSKKTNEWGPHRWYSIFLTWRNNLTQSVSVRYVTRSEPGYVVFVEISL